MRRTRTGSSGFADRELSPVERIPATILYPVKLVTHLGLMGMAVASVAPLLASWMAPLAVFESFRLHIALASLPLTLLALCFRPRALALLGPLAFAWNIVTIWPYLPLDGAEVGLANGAAADAQTGPASPSRFKVVSANLWYRNDGYEAGLHYFESTDADVIALIEVTPQWMTALQPLYAKYPYRIDCMQSTPPCEMMLISKHPFQHSFAGRIEGRSPTITWGEIAIGGRSVTVAATHLAWPLRAAMDRDRIAFGAALQPQLADAYPLVQSEQAANLAQYLKGLGPDLVLMGDFNSVPWSRTQSVLRAETGLENAGPMVPSWPSWQPFWDRLPIDQIMTRGALSRHGFKTGFYIGSDHLPVEAEITLEPK